MSLPGFRLLLKLALRDRLSLGWALVFPVLMIVGLSLFFSDPAYRLRLLAGMLLVSALFYVSYGVAFDVQTQRNRGVYKLLRLTPVGTVAFILELTLARGAVALGCTAVVLLAGLIILQIPVSLVSLPVLLIVLALGMLVFTPLGVIVGNLGNEASQVATLNNFITLPLLFLTEAFYSLAQAPVWVQLLRDVLPFNHFLNAIRTCLEGHPGEAVVPMLIVMGYGVLFLALARLTFRWDEAAPVGGRLALSKAPPQGTG